MFLSLESFKTVRTKSNGVKLLNFFPSQFEIAKEPIQVNY